MTEAELKRIILLDLAKHMEQKLMTAIEDFVDRCGDSDIDMHDAAIQILTVISHHAALAAHALQASQHEFLAVCHHQYGRGEQCLKQIKASR